MTFPYCQLTFIYHLLILISIIYEEDKVKKKRIVLNASQLSPKTLRILLACSTDCYFSFKDVIKSKKKL